MSEHKKGDMKKEYGWLKPLEKVEAPPGKYGVEYTRSSWWRCRCRCGKEVVKPYAYLRQSPTPHCGCRKGQIRRAQKKIGHDGSCRLQREPDGSLSLRNREGKLYGVMRNDCKCRVCGKVFDNYAGTDWAWRMMINSNVVYFCSYGCMRKMEAKRFPPKKAGGYAY